MPKIKDETTKLMLKQARYNITIFSIEELATMFKCGRACIDNAINTGKLPYFSPNNKDRYVYLNDFEKYLKENGSKWN